MGKLTDRLQDQLAVRLGKINELAGKEFGLQYSPDSVLVSLWETDYSSNTRRVTQEMGVATMLTFVNGMLAGLTCNLNRE